MKRFKPGSWRRALDWLVRLRSAMPSVLSRLFWLSADYSQTEKSPLSRFSASPLHHPTSSIAPMPPHAPGLEHIRTRDIVNSALDSAIPTDSGPIATWLGSAHRLFLRDLKRHYSSLPSRHEATESGALSYYRTGIL